MRFPRWPWASSNVLCALVEAAMNDEWERGRAVTKLEEEIRKLHGGHPVCVPSGTAALELMMLTLARNARVVGVPAYTWVTVPGMIDRLGHKIVFRDLDPETGDPVYEGGADVEIVTSLFGRNPPRLLPGTAPLKIMDACQCLGQIQVKPPYFASFNYTKVAPSFGGGVAVFSNADDARRARNVVDAKHSVGFADGEVFGSLNMRMNSATAAVALVGVREVPHVVARGSRNWVILKDRLGDLLPGGASYCHKTPIKVTGRVEEVVTKFIEDGVPYAAEWSCVADPANNPGAIEFRNSIVFLGSESSPVHEWDSTVTMNIAQTLEELLR